MLSYLYDLLMSFITLILGFFGIGKKSVRFAEDTDTPVEKEEEPTQAETV